MCRVRIRVRVRVGLGLGLVQPARRYVCRRVAAHLKEEAQAIILTETRDELFDSFVAKHPGVDLKRTVFYEVP